MKTSEMERKEIMTAIGRHLRHFSPQIAGMALLLMLTQAAAMVLASDKADGYFLANRDCPALQSFRKGTNPGARALRPGERYRVVEVNDAANIAWVRVRLDGEPRWVAADCGAIASRNPASAEPPATGEKCRRAEEYDGFVLAVTWQPGFCEHFPYQGPKPECQAMAEGRLALSHLTLHGLWPNQAACGKDYGHCPGEELALSQETVAAIREWLPNLHFESAFASYQWKKHGRCQRQLDDDGYFRRAVDYVKLVNDSPLGAYIAANIGGSIERRRFYELVASTYGQGARNKIQLICAGNHLQELRLRLPARLPDATSLSDLLDGETSGALAGDGRECRGDRIAIEKSGP